MPENLSDFLLHQWAEHSLGSTGRLLPITEIGAAGPVGTLQHTVPDGDPPLVIFGTACRTLALTYELGTVASNDLN